MVVEKRDKLKKRIIELALSITEVFLIKVIKPVEQLSLTTYVASILGNVASILGTAKNSSLDFTYVRVMSLL